jgi:hypothetical protein
LQRIASTNCTTACPCLNFTAIHSRPQFT